MIIRSLRCCRVGRRVGGRDGEFFFGLEVEERRRGEDEYSPEERWYSPDERWCEPPDERGGVRVEGGKARREAVIICSLVTSL